MFLYKESALFLGFYSGFTRGEYHIVCVDFICSLRGRKRKLRLAYGFCSGFTRGEYHIVCVDFIDSSRGRLKRDRGFANPLSLSNTSPDPWGNPLRRGILAAAGLQGFSQPVSGADRSSPVPNFIWLSVFGLVSLAFQSGCWAGIVRFSLLGGRSFVSAATWGFAMVCSWICADRDWVDCFIW